MRTFPCPDVSPAFFPLLAAMVLLLPLRWCLAFFSAALVHESCHLLALYLCGEKASHFSVSAAGATIRSTPLPRRQALLCTVAGPLGGLLLVPLAQWFPRLAICAATQSVFNLLPIRSLDGGQVLRICLEHFLPRDTADSLCHRTEVLIFTVTAALGIYCSFVLKLGLLPVLVAGMVITKGRIGKIPCK